MSLTSQLEQRDSPVRHFFDARLSDADGLKWLRQRYATVQCAVARSAGAALRVPPPPEIDPGARASLLGTAADYRLRLLLSGGVDDVWRTGAARLGADLAYLHVARHDEVAAEAFYAAVEALVARAEQALGGTDPAAEEQLCRTCNVLGWLDTVSRMGGRLPEPLEAAVAGPPAGGLEELVAKACAEDTAAVAEAARTELLAELDPIGRVVAGPSFALSADVGGADADVVVDGLVVDFKTTAKNPRKRDGTQTLAQRDAWQLAGYALLDADDAFGVERVGVYLTRQAVLVCWSAEDFLGALAGEGVDLLQLRAEFAEALDAAPGRAPQHGGVERRR